MSSYLNGRLEVGLRVGMLLAEAFPRGFDLARLVLLDHAVLHSGDLGGPTSIHPPLPLRSGELGIKRTTITSGIELACRVGLVEMDAHTTGIEFRATDRAPGFLSLLTVDYSHRLRERIQWVVSSFDDVDDQHLRELMSSVFGHRSEEFESPDNMELDGTA